jgi:hypothetical protein
MRVPDTCPLSDLQASLDKAGAALGIEVTIQSLPQLTSC